MSQSTIQSARSSVFSALREVQKEGKKIFISFLIGFLGTIIGLQTLAWEFFESVMRSGMSESLSQQVNIIARNPFEVLLIQAKVGLFVGIAFTVPVLIYIARKRFIIDRGIEGRIPTYAYLLTIGSGIVLFFAGLWYSYFVFFPIVFQFLARATIDTGINPMYSIAKWTEFMVLLSLSFGLIAQIPVSIPALVRYKVVRYETIRSSFRYWIVGTLILGAILSPPEPISQLLWSGPLIGLYISAIIISKYIDPVDRASENVNNNNKPDERPDSQESDINQEVSSDLDLTDEDGFSNYEKVVKIGQSLKSNALILMITFMIGGIISFYAQFTFLTEDSIDLILGSTSGVENLDIVALHPVEVLTFQAKMAVILALIPTVLVALWKIWPSIKSDGIVKMSRANMITFITVPAVTLFLGSIVGLLYISPDILEFLIYDANRIDAVISYQIKNFFWIILYVTIITGLSISVYLSVMYWYMRGISATVFSKYWRQVVFGVLIFSMFITPDSILKSLLFMALPTVSYLLAVFSMRVIEGLKDAFR